MIGIQMGSQDEDPILPDSIIEGIRQKIAALEAENKALSLLLAQKDEALKGCLAISQYIPRAVFDAAKATLSASHHSVEHAKKIMAVVEAAKALAADSSEHLGVYPASVVDNRHPQNSYEQRTPEMNAWNEKVTALLQSVAALSRLKK